MERAVDVLRNKSRNGRTEVQLGVVSHSLNGKFLQVLRR
jgi:hypothetical protein